MQQHRKWVWWKVQNASLSKNVGEVLEVEYNLNKLSEGAARTLSTLMFCTSCRGAAPDEGSVDLLAGQVKQTFVRHRFPELNTYGAPTNN